MSLNGKVALVTGGTRGIGAAIATRLAREGADVAATFVTRGAKVDAFLAEIGRYGRRGLAIQADNADAAAVRQAVERTVAEFGRLDILVNNAGIFSGGPFEELTVEDFDRLVAINTRAVFVASQKAAEHLPEGGRIISIGSNLAERVPLPGLTLYSATKSALVGLTRGMARDLGSRGINVNVVHPGSTATDMNPDQGDHAEGQRAMMAIPRYGKPGDIASLVAWLASDESRFMTGAALTIDGGANA